MSNKLSQYFQGIATKRLSQVEVEPAKSNQHEFNSTVKMKEIFGTERVKFNGTFIYLSDQDGEQLMAKGPLTWYDAREGHPTRSEFRLYYSTNAVTEIAKPEDLIVIAKQNKNEVFIIIVPAFSTVERQLLWLFDIKEIQGGFVTRNFIDQEKELGFAGKYILASIGIDTTEEDTNYLEIIFRRFGKEFPSTKVFSSFVRELEKNVDPINNPDETLLQFMQTEERMFKTLENYFVKEKLLKGFGKNGDDVDDFIAYSLSVQNRRKSRAGRAFENHLAYLFDSSKILYSAGARTERNNTPDFIFPNISHYHNKFFPSQLLTMLGLKTSAKDRWRQVITEADKIAIKHLITLEPSISSNQTQEMAAKGVQLVIPGKIIETYTPDQKQKYYIAIRFYKSSKR